MTRKLLTKLNKYDRWIVFEKEIKKFLKNSGNSVRIILIFQLIKLINFKINYSLFYSMHIAFGIKQKCFIRIHG